MAKIVSRFPESLLNQLEQSGYRPLTSDGRRAFDPYYDEMNGHWSAASSFLTMIAWNDAIPTFYKPAEGLLFCMQYDGTDEGWTAIPFLGRYSQNSITRALRVLSEDLKTLGFPLKVMGVTPWMLPFYQGQDEIVWEVESPRDSMEYIYQREDFLESLNSSDSRYRYRYFLRRFESETVVLTSANAEECLDCVRAVWCSGAQCPDCFACPLEAVGAVMRAFDDLRADGLLVRVDGKPAGFCVTSCRNGLGIYHFKHTNNRLKGINEYLLRECFERFLDGAEEINFTEDLGVESLRAYKRKLAPYTLLPRMTLRGRRVT